MKRLVADRDNDWLLEHPTHPKNVRAQLDCGLNFMFLAAFPLLLWVFQESFAGIATAIALIWILSLALRLISVGQKLQYDYEITEAAKAPRIPRKLIGSILIGFVVFALAGHKFDNLILPALSGLVGVFLSVTAFGFDPRKDKVDNKPVELAALEAAEDALSALADRIAALDDMEVTLRTEAARELVLRPMRSNASNPRALKRTERPVLKMISLLSAEVSRLESSWNGMGHNFARRRFLAKLDVMTESYETLAYQSGRHGARDAFERQADLLLDRMPRESAA